MKISIITATYNSIRYLNSCLTSLELQGHDDIEHIVVDGLSSDGTVDYLKQHLSKETKFISESDFGLYDALNKGIFLSSGLVVGILHSDDTFYNSGVLEKINEIFSNNQNIDVVIGNAVYVNGEYGQRNIRFYNSSLFRPWMLRFGFMPAHTATFFRKTIYDKFGDYDINYKSAGDFDFFVRVFSDKNIKYIFTDINVVKMRMGGTSTSGMRSFIRTSREILRSLKINKIYTNLFFVISRLPVKYIYDFTFRVIKFLRNYIAKSVRK